MKYLLLLVSLFVIKVSSAQQSLSKKEMKNIENFIHFVKVDDKKKLSELVHYPLNVKGGKVKVKNKADFIKSYPLIFDKELKQFIVKSKLKDWDRVGIKGIMLNEGEVWFNEDATKLISVNGLN